MGVVCSRPGPHQVVPLQARPSNIRRIPSCGTRKPNSGQLTKKIPVNPCPPKTVNIHVGAFLLPVSKIIKDMGLHTEVYKHPVVAVNITVISTVNFNTNILSNPIIDWGALTVVNQVPKELPSVLRPGTTVIHAVLERPCPDDSSITLSGTVNGKKMDYRATVEENVQYVEDLTVMADILQMLQEQQEEKGKGNKAEQAENRNPSINTGSNTTNDAKMTKHTPSTSPPSATVTEEAVPEDNGLRDTRVYPPTRRKDTPAAMQLTGRPRKNSSLRERIEASVFPEEDEEETESDSLQRRMSRCVSISRFGRMSRMSRRRYSMSSLDIGTSDSSLMVNPPGSMRGLQTRMSRRKRDRRVSSYSRSDSVYRHKWAMAMSDVETSAVESERLPSFSSVGGSWSESTCGVRERRLSRDKRHKTEKLDSYQTDTSSKGASSDEKINCRRLSSNDLNIKRTSFSESEVVESSAPYRVRQRNGLQTGKTSNAYCSKCKEGFQQQSSGRRLRHMNSVIVEEADPGEESETDGCVSDVNKRRRWSSISRSTMRRKRFSKRKITYTNVVRLPKIGDMPTSNGHGQLPLTKVDESSFESRSK